MQPFAFGRARLVALLASASLFSGCYWSFTHPGERGALTKYEISATDFEALGPVFDGGSVNAILYWFIWDDNEFGYTKLVDKARREMGADTVIDVAVDSHVSSILGVFGAREWRASGVAIRYKIRGQLTPISSSPAQKPSSMSSIGDGYVPSVGDVVERLVFSWGAPEKKEAGGNDEAFYYYTRNGVRYRIQIVNYRVVSIATVR